MQGHAAMQQQQQQAALQQAQMAAAAAAAHAVQQSGHVGFPPIGGFDNQGRGRGGIGGLIGGRGRGRKRKERDLNRAPRQPSQYNLFMKTEVARIKQVQPELSHKEAFKEAARNWGVSDANPQKRVSLDGGAGADVPPSAPAFPGSAEDGDDEDGADGGEESAADDFTAGGDGIDPEGEEEGADELKLEADGPLVDRAVAEEAAEAEAATAEDGGEPAGNNGAESFAETGASVELGESDGADGLPFFDGVVAAAGESGDAEGGELFGEQ